MPQVRLSKLLSNLLRHQADVVGVDIDKTGWVMLKAALEYAIYIYIYIYMG